MRSILGWVLCVGLALSACTQGDNGLPDENLANSGLSGQAPGAGGGRPLGGGPPSTSAPAAGGGEAAGGDGIAGAGGGAGGPDININNAPPQTPPSANTLKDEVCQDIVDAKLREAVRAALKLTDPSAAITKAAVGGLLELNLQAYVADITSLAGIGCLSSLPFINLDGSRVKDFQPLATLPNLSGISMKNQVVVPPGSLLDISSLQALKATGNPYKVNLEGNKVDPCAIQGLIEGLKKDGQGNPTEGVMVMSPEQFGSCTTKTNLDLTAIAAALQAAQPASTPETLTLFKKAISPQITWDVANTVILNPTLPKDWPTVCSENKTDVGKAIPDENLRAAIKTKLGLKPMDPISYFHTKQITQLLVATDMGIASLSGLQCFENLKTISFKDNAQIMDITPLIDDPYISNAIVGLKGDFNVALWQIKKLQAKGAAVIYDKYAPWPEPYVGSQTWQRYSLTLALDTSSLTGGVTFTSQLMLSPQMILDSTAVTVKKGDLVATLDFNANTNTFMDLRNATFTVMGVKFSSNDAGQTLRVMGAKGAVDMWNNTSKIVFWHPCVGKSVSSGGFALSQISFPLGTDTAGYCAIGQLDDSETNSHIFTIDFATTTHNFNLLPKLPNPTVVGWADSTPLGDVPQFKLSHSGTLKAQLKINKFQVWAFRPAYPEFIVDSACDVSGGSFQVTMEIKEPYYPDSALQSLDHYKNGYWLMYPYSDPKVTGQCSKLKDLSPQLKPAP